MNVKDVNLDTHEMILTVEQGSKIERQKLKYDQLLRVETGEEQVKKWFRTKNVSVLKLHSKTKSKPFIVRKDKMGPAYESTIAALKRYADRYRFEVIEKE